MPDSFKQDWEAGQGLVKMLQERGAPEITAKWAVKTVVLRGELTGVVWCAERLKGIVQRAVDEGDVETARIAKKIAGHLIARSRELLADLELLKEEPKDHVQH